MLERRWGWSARWRLRALSRLLFSVGPHDPVAFGCVALLMVAVALIATLVPATSATRVDPTVALRCD